MRQWPDVTWWSLFFKKLFDTNGYRAELSELVKPKYGADVDSFLKIIITTIISSSTQSGAIPEYFNRTLRKHILSDSFKATTESELSIVSKILEKLVPRQLVKVLQSNNAFELFKIWPLPL